MLGQTPAGVKPSRPAVPCHSWGATGCLPATGLHSHPRGRPALHPVLYSYGQICR